MLKRILKLKYKFILPLKLYVYFAFSWARGIEARPAAVVRFSIVVVGKTGLISYIKGNKDSYPIDLV
jgi:hypothetical protein